MVDALSRPPFKVIVAGGRDFEDYDFLRDSIYKFFGDYIEQDRLEIVSGGAKGADSFATQFADIHWCAYKEFPADWDNYGKSAGAIRNAEMAEYADALIAFWDGQSRGTANMIEQMQKRKKPYVVIPYASH